MVRVEKMSSLFKKISHEIVGVPNDGYVECRVHEEGGDLHFDDVLLNWLCCSVSLRLQTVVLQASQIFLLQNFGRFHTHFNVVWIFG